MGDEIKQIAQWLCESNFTVGFTGAGVSTESGIPDFRSPGGVWANSQPVYYQEFLRSYESRYEYWRQKSIAHRDFADAQPNVTHTTLARWEETGLINGVITQNIDGLHTVAGNQSVLELHGTAREVSCLDCEARFEAEPWVQLFVKSDQVPICPDCGGKLKHATISFGQSLPPEVLHTAAEWTDQCDLFIAMGSSLVVEPAASLPRFAKEQGSRLVIINRDPTPLDVIADLTIAAGLGETMQAIHDALPENVG